MKCLLFICCLVGVLPVFSQQAGLLFSEEYIPLKLSGNSRSAVLSRELTNAGQTDFQKVSSIFHWIVDNIDYRTRQSRAGARPYRSSQKELQDTGALMPLDERVAENVIESRLAICDGYARLFKTLCDYAGVEAVVISGYARTEAGKRIQRFRTNHSWNAVRIDSVWQLLDVTWASGYITWQGDRFVRYYDEQYFLTPPDQFIREHFPDDLHWTLMSDPPLMPEFRYSPYKQKSFTKYKIASYQPAAGLIEANQGDTLAFELASHDVVSDSRISADPFLDTAAFRTTTSVLLAPVSITRNTISYVYVASSPAIQWIYILYNDDLVLRYKLRIRFPVANRGPVGNRF